MNELTIPEEITTLGAAIRWARRQRGWTVSELAFCVGMSMKAVQNIEYGLKNTSRVARFETELEVKLSHLPVWKTHQRANREPPLPRRPSGNRDRRVEPKRKRLWRTDMAGLPAPLAPEDEGSRERALTLGLRGESTHIFQGCNYCHDMSWRRHPDGCRGCGLPHAPEPSAHAISGAVSNAAYMAEPGDTAA